MYAVNTSDARQVNRIATGENCSSSGTYRVTSYPESFPIRETELVQSVDRLLLEMLRGKEVGFQYGTPLKGFRDKGITKDWGIDKRGVADFSGLKLGTSGSELSEIQIYSTASIVPTAVTCNGVQPVVGNVFR